jgi:predicted O-methyltransferase YrrM
LDETGKVDLAFIDGNHRKQPTLDYFTKLLNHSTTSTILIFDDIHWSEEMEAAWSVIQQNPSVTLTIDLFFIGLVFLNPTFKVKQHFSIRF